MLKGTLCAVKHKVSARTAYALFPDRTHFALSEIYGCRQTVFPGLQAPDEKTGHVAGSLYTSNLFGYFAASDSKSGLIR